MFIHYYRISLRPIFINLRVWTYLLLGSTSYEFKLSRKQCFSRNEET